MTYVWNLKIKYTNSSVSFCLGIYLSDIAPAPRERSAWRVWKRFLCAHLEDTQRISPQGAGARSQIANSQASSGKSSHATALSRSWAAQPTTRQLLQNAFRSRCEWPGPDVTRACAQHIKHIKFARCQWNHIFEYSAPDNLFSRDWEKGEDLLCLCEIKESQTPTSAQVEKLTAPRRASLMADGNSQYAHASRERSNK